MNPIITDYLYHLNAIETKQLQEGKFYFNFPAESVENKNNELVFLNEFFLSQRDIYISKHNRFADYPLHTHEFLEFNFMLKGEAQQVINQQAVTLKEGQLLLLDRGSAHEIKKMGHDDIMLNILFKNRGMNLDWLTTLNQESNLVFDFLMQHIRESSKRSYILFESSENQHVQEIIQRILHEYFLGQRLTDNLISLYIPILITELVANVAYVTDRHPHATENALMVKLLHEIEAHYATISLQSIAETFGYNKNYLSNHIKRSTGFTFTQLLNQERMRQAKFYLLNTDYPIEKVMQQIGLENKTYFYKLFQEAYQLTPYALRKKQKTD